REFGYHPIQGGLFPLPEDNAQLPPHQPGAVILVDLLQGPGELVEKQLVLGPEIAALGEFLQTLFQTPAPSMGIVQMEDLVDHMVSGKGQAQAVHKTLVEFKAITG